jgi:hypothetical protein
LMGVPKTWPYFFKGFFGLAPFYRPNMPKLFPTISLFGRYKGR